MPDAEPRLQGLGFVLRPWHGDDLDSLVLNANDPDVSKGCVIVFPIPIPVRTAKRFSLARY